MKKRWDLEQSPCTRCSVCVAPPDPTGQRVQACRIWQRWFRIRWRRAVYRLRRAASAQGECDGACRRPGPPLRPGSSPLPGPAAAPHSGSRCPGTSTGRRQPGPGYGALPAAPRPGHTTGAPRR